MNIATYQLEAKRTMKKDLKGQLQLSNMMMGIDEETAEVLEQFTEPTGTREGIRDEVGDVFWYIANTCSIFNREFNLLFPSELDIQLHPITALMLKMSMRGGFASGLVKKWIGQVHELDLDKMFEHLEKLVESLCGILAFYDVTVEEALSSNIQKLRKRYPNETFEAERSINREV